MAKSKRNNKKQRAKAQKSAKVKRKQAAPSIFEHLKRQLQNTWLTRSPIFLFVLLFGVLMTAFYILWLMPFFQRTVVETVARIDAQLASLALNLFGQGTSCEGDIVASSDFSVSIKRGCDGIEATAVYLAGVLAFPIAFSRKVPGLLWGTAFLFMANLLRVITLFLVGVYIPVAFDIMHIEVWQALFLILAVACWLYWIQWAMKKDKIDA